MLELARARGKADDANGGRVDVKGLLPDFDVSIWAGRLTVIMFDARPNESVQAGRRGLARELRQRGADVRHGRLPDDDHRINGPDDLIAFQGIWRCGGSSIRPTPKISGEVSTPTRSSRR